jgi:hypothetical protein
MKVNLNNRTELIRQNELDLIDSIELMEAGTELSSEHIINILHDKASYETRKRKRKIILLTSTAACVLLAVTLNFNIIYTFASELFTKVTIKSYDEIIITQNHLENTAITWPEKMDDYGTYASSKYYSSLEAVTKDLNIVVLQNSMAWDNTTFNVKVLLTLPVKDISLGEIWDTVYIVGDMKDIEVQGGGIIFKAGEDFTNPVQLKILFSIDGLPVTTTEQIQTFEDMELLETYNSPNGIDAKIFMSGSRIQAVFYDEGMEYLLSGYVSKDIMEEIIDSFY